MPISRYRLVGRSDDGTGLGEDGGSHLRQAEHRDVRPLYEVFKLVDAVTNTAESRWKIASGLISSNMDA